jgi:arginine decarboxylase
MMDHNEVPVLDALVEYRRRGHTPFTPPGQKQGRGAVPWVREVLDNWVFRNDVLATSGRDGRLGPAR